MSNPNRQILGIIDQAALKLPAVTELTHEIHMVKGSEMIQIGYTEISEDEKVDPEETYNWPMPVLMQVNHKRRMKQAYRDGGQAAVLGYIKNIVQIAKNHAHEQRKTA